MNKVEVVQATENLVQAIMAIRKICNPLSITYSDYPDNTIRILVDKKTFVNLPGKAKLVPFPDKTKKYPWEARKIIDNIIYSVLILKDEETDVQ